MPESSESHTTCLCVCIGRNDYLNDVYKELRYRFRCVTLRADLLPVNDLCFLLCIQLLRHLENSLIAENVYYVKFRLFYIVEKTRDQDTSVANTTKPLQVVLCVSNMKSGRRLV